MKLSKIAVATAALTMVASPVVAQADRASAPVSDESEIGGSGVLLAVLAVAAIIAGLVILVDSDDEAVSA